MKKIIIPILAVSFLVLTGCYKGDDTATIRINLGNLPVAKNVQPKTFLDRVRSFFVKDAYAADQDVYIGAVKDNVSLGSVILNRNEISNDTVELEVTAGDNISIFIIYDNTGNYYYTYTTVNLNAGETKNVTLSVTSYLEDILDITHHDSTYLTWNEIPGAQKYTLYRDSVKVYEGLATRWDGDTDTGFYIIISFGFIEVTIMDNW